MIDTRKTRDRRRPRGYAPWEPSSDVEQVVKDAIAILSAFVPVYGPMTLRQVFYRLVATRGFPKDGAKRLSNYLTRARRARMIPWEWMRDDRGVTQDKDGWASADQLIDYTRDWVEHFALHGDIGQPYEIFIWCEAAGIVPMIARMVAPYGVKVRSKSGFDGSGAKEAFAREVAEAGRPVRLLHLGDYDVSGVHIYASFAEDIQKFLRDVGLDDEDYLLPERVALTEAQMLDLGLPTESRKRSQDGKGWADNRSYSGIAGDVSVVCQLEALAPPDLEQIIIAAILRLWDHDAHAALLGQQERDRSRLAAWLG